MRWAFLALAIVGAVLPLWHFTAYMAEGQSLIDLIAVWFANDSTAGLAWDLLITATALTVWVVWEARRTGDRLRLVVIPVIFGIGVSCALPLYLFLRTRQAA
jgi:hypothetical protein